MHTLLDLRGNIPSFVHISNGKLHDVHALDLLIPEAGAIYLMDRGYIDFARLYVLQQAGAFFVTRAKSGKSGRSGRRWSFVVIAVIDCPAPAVIDDVQPHESLRFLPRSALRGF